MGHMFCFFFLFQITHDIFTALLKFSYSKSRWNSWTVTNLHIQTAEDFFCTFLPFSAPQAFPSPLEFSSHHTLVLIKCTEFSLQWLRKWSAQSQIVSVLSHWGFSLPWRETRDTRERENKPGWIQKYSEITDTSGRTVWIWMNVMQVKRELDGMKRISV